MSYSHSAVIFFFLFCNIISVLSDPGAIIIPCKRNDDLCMTKSANIAVSFLAAGIPSLNIEPIDLINPGDVVGNHSELYIKISNSRVSGYEKCEIYNVQLNLEDSTLQFNLKCPLLISNGYYEASGQLVKLGVEVSGPYEVITGKYEIDVDANIERVEGSDGNEHLAIKTFKTFGHGLEPIKLDFKNLSPSRKETYDTIRNFEREKYKELNRIIVPTYIESVFKVIIRNINKLLETVPFDNLFIE